MNMTSNTPMPREFLESFRGPLSDEEWHQYCIENNYPVETETLRLPPNLQTHDSLIATEESDLQELSGTAIDKVQAISTDTASGIVNTRLAHIPAPLIPDACNFVTPEDWFTHLNSILSVVMVNGSMSIFCIEYNYALKRTNVIFYKRRDLSAFFANQSILDSNKKLINPFNYWFNHPQRRSHTSVQFAPGITTPPHVYNLWQGYSYLPSTSGSWSLLKEHIRHIIANDDPIHFNYILDWMADLVQLKPNKPGVALVFMGKKGCGKGIVASSLGKLFGSHYIHLVNSKHLTGPFNAHFKDILLAFADEAFFSGDRQAESSLKGLITEHDILIEPKGVDAFTVQSNVRIIIASNSYRVVPSSVDERRYHVSQVSSEKIGDTQYFNDIQTQLNQGGYAAMLYELLHRDISQSNLRAPPRTKALSEQTYLDNVVLQFLIHCIEVESLYCVNGAPQPWNEGLVLASTLRNEFNAFVKQQGKSNQYTEHTFGKALSDLLNVNDYDDHPDNCVKHRKTRKDLDNTLNTNQKPCYQFKSIPECKVMIEKKFDTGWNWNDADILDESSSTESANYD